ncbi:MAG TPA: hypothetical protein VF876_14015 [Burkholderiales bacterium]
MFANVAHSRLLPMSVPFRYFGAAVAFHVLAWAALLAGARDVPGFAGGLGMPFAALHLATLGVIAMAAIGATLQLLPVATRQPVRAIGAAKLLWWLLAPGVLLFAGGAAAYAPRVMAPGAALAIAALAVYAVLLGRNLWSARGMPVVVAHGWAALASLVGLALTGLALVARYEHGLALDHTAFRGAHLVLAAYGFMGLLVLGLSQFLLPMLAIARPPTVRSAYAALAAAFGALALALAGFFAGSEALVVAAAVAGLGAAGVHVVSLERSLRARLRPALGPAFALVRLSWVLLLASLVLAGAMALGWAPPRAGVLFVLLLVPGWLLTFLLAVLQRIVPFLASVHAGTGSPLASALSPEGPLVAHRLLHVAALASLLLAVLLDAPWFAHAAAAAGLAGALAFAAFFIGVLARLREAREAAPA